MNQIAYVSVISVAIMTAVIIFAHWQKSQDEKRDALKRDAEAAQDD